MMRQIQTRRCVYQGAAIISLLCLWVVAPVQASTFYASQVVSTSPGSNQNSSFDNTDLALGGPQGTGVGSGSFDVYNLGVSGSITLSFNTATQTRSITNGTGADFIVFGNAFYAGSQTNASYAKLMFVEVSSNGTNFARFPVTSNTASSVGPYGTIDPANVSGFAGVHPTQANVKTNQIDPFDPAVAGGDAFDLSALTQNSLVKSGLVDLNAISEIRLVDVLGDGSLLDQNNHPIYDPSGAPFDIGSNLDAVAVIHGTATPEPGTVMLLGLALLAVATTGRRWLLFER